MEFLKEGFSWDNVKHPLSFSTGKVEPPRQSLSGKQIAVAVAALVIFLPLLGAGIPLFFAITGYFKSREIKKLSLKEGFPPSANAATALKANTQAQQRFTEEYPSPDISPRQRSFSEPPPVTKKEPPLNGVPKLEPKPPLPPAPEPPKVSFSPEDEMLFLQQHDPDIPTLFALLSKAEGEARRPIVDELQARLTVAAQNPRYEGLEEYAKKALERLPSLPPAPEKPPSLFPFSNVQEVEILSFQDNEIGVLCAQLASVEGAARQPIIQNLRDRLNFIANNPMGEGVAGIARKALTNLGGPSSFSSFSRAFEDDPSDILAALNDADLRDLSPVVEGIKNLPVYLQSGPFDRILRTQFDILATPGDGDCCVYALVKAATETNLYPELQALLVPRNAEEGALSMAQLIRKRAIDYMEMVDGVAEAPPGVEDRGNFRPFSNQIQRLGMERKDLTWAEYRLWMRQKGTYFGPQEIRAIAEMTGLLIGAYNPQGVVVAGDQMRLRGENCYGPRTGKFLALSHTGGNHYELLIPKTGVAVPRPTGT